MRAISFRIALTLLAAGASASLPGCGSQTTSSGGGKPQLAFVINSSSDFWVLARAGIRKAEKEFDVDVDFQVPGQGTAAQQREIIETLIAKGIDGMAVSVLDPKGAIDILNQAVERMPVVTQDSDAPDSKRKVYIGTNNVEAGRVAGREIIKALTEGGKVSPGKIALFVGKLDVANARERKQGIEETLKDTGIEVVETFTDETKRPTAQTNVRNALDKYPDLKCLVGLWSYNPPAIIHVLKEKGLAGKIKVVAFDEEQATLDGLVDDTVFSTVVQQPYEFGYQSVKVLAKLTRKESIDLPADGLLYVPVKVIDKSSVAEFKQKVDQMLKEGR